MLCAGRACLFNKNEQSGASYDQRKQRLISLLRFLSYVHAIDVCLYAKISNYYHVVLYVDKARELACSPHEVEERSMQAYAGHPLVDELLKHPARLGATQQAAVVELIKKWRIRLYEIEWFTCVSMKPLPTWPIK